MKQKTMLKKPKLYLKLVAMLLSLVMLIFSSSLGAFAVDDSTEAPSADATAESIINISDSVESTDALSYLETQSFISSERIGNVIEITDRREENVKHFALPDGTVEAVVYAKPVHRKDASGVWQDINNNLISSNNGKYGTADGRISFSQSLPSLTISEDGYTVSMEYAENESPSLGNIESTDTVTYIPSVINAPARDIKYDTLEEAQKINNKGSLTYTSNKSKIEYILDGNNVKENIIINSPLSSYEYIFKLTLGGLTAVLSDNGDILLNDGEDTKYIIPAPFMYDAEGNVSYDAEYELIEVKEGLYLIRLTASSEWINHEDRVFPVTLDPSINSPSDTIKDTYVSSVWSERNTNYNGLDYLELGFYKSVYIYVEPPQLPANITVNTATLNVYNYYDGYEGSMTVGVHEIREPWEDDTVTASSNLSYEEDPFTTVSMTAEPEYSEYNARQASIPIISYVTEWISPLGTEEYYGFALRHSSGTIDSSGHISLISSESSMDMGALISINYSYDLIDGVYAFKNLGASSRWMTVPLAEGQSVPIVGTHVQQKHSSTNLADEDVFDRTSLFKVTKIYDAVDDINSIYTITSMLDNSMHLQILANGQAVVDRIYPYESITSAEMFRFEPVGRYFNIISCAYGGTEVLAVINTSTPDLSTVEQESTKARWEIYRYTGVEQANVTVEYPSSWDDVGIISERTYDVSVEPILWSTCTNIGEPYIDLHDDFTDMGDFTWNENTGLGTFVAEKFGTVRFVCKIPYGNGQTANIVSYDFQIVPQEGTYYIQNVQTENYVDTGAWSDAPNSAVYQSEFTNGTNLRWIIEHAEGTGGYVRIKSAYSEYYLGVNSNNITEVIEKSATSNSTDPYVLWKIEKSYFNRFLIVCKATEDTGYVLSISETETDSNLIQAPLANEFFLTDKWFVHIYKDASLIAFESTRAEAFPAISQTLNSMGYTDIFDNSSTLSLGMLADEVLSRMSYSRIALIRTHGNASGIQLSDNSYITQSMLEQNVGDYFKCTEVLIYGACGTALGGRGADNLAQTTVDVGARTVIGFQNTVHYQACNDWCEKFFEYYEDYSSQSEKTILNACFETTKFYLPTVSETIGSINESIYGKYEYVDGDGTLVSVRNYVVCGEYEFP